MNPKSKTCVGKATGRPLTEFRSGPEARQAAEYENAIGGGDVAFVPYECGTCGKWHLSPAGRQTPSAPCVYCGKDLYATRDAAQRRADISRRERGVKLSVYPCGDGWHLTKRA